jgi:transposase IS4-like protein
LARTPSDLSTGARITDYISLGVVTKSIPLSTVKSVPRSAEKLSRRERALPAHVVVYYVIALALYMQVAYREVLRCLPEGIQWLVNPSESLRGAGKPASRRHAHGRDGNRCSNCMRGW